MQYFGNHVLNSLPDYLKKIVEHKKVECSRKTVKSRWVLT